MEIEFAPLKINTTFFVKGRGLIIIPNLPSRVGHSTMPLHTKIKIYAPDGTEKQFDGKFQAEHFLLEGNTSEWRTILLLEDASRQDVPLGSQLRVSKETLAILTRVGS